MRGLPRRTILACRVVAGAPLRGGEAGAVGGMGSTGAVVRGWAVAVGRVRTRGDMTGYAVVARDVRGSVGRGAVGRAAVGRGAMGRRAVAARGAVGSVVAVAAQVTAIRVERGCTDGATLTTPRPATTVAPGAAVSGSVPPGTRTVRATGVDR